jgi:hypothetical protein
MVLDAVHASGYILYFHAFQQAPVIFGCGIHSPGFVIIQFRPEDNVLEISPQQVFQDFIARHGGDLQMEIAVEHQFFFVIFIGSVFFEDPEFFL